MRSSAVPRVSRGIVCLLLVSTAAITLTPLLWLLATSIKAPDDLFHYMFFSPRPTLYNFQDLFRTTQFLRYMMNSLFVACASVTVQLVLSSLAGFALAKYEFKCKKAIMLLMLATVT